MTDDTSGNGTRVSMEINLDVPGRNGAPWYPRQMPDASPGATLSHYTLVEKIGEGGMGVVYKALDTRLHRHVAIKILRPELTVDPERQQRFLREARAAAAVSHPGIATIHAIDEADGVTFIVMELVEGRSLGVLIRAQSLSTVDALHVAIQVADAMARAHETRVIHRDLKPDNIIVGADRRARILDFGLAKILELAEPAGATDSGVEEATTRDVAPGGRLLGTVSYMSPEQARGEEVDARSDIFSFGVTLYEMLTGSRPFAATTVTGTLAKILETEPEPLARLKPDLPEALQKVVQRCLRKHPEERFASASELAGALREVDLEARVVVSSSTIAVFPFSFRGSEEFAYLRAGLVDLLSTKLDGAGELRSVDPHVVLCCADLDAAGTTDPDAAGALARRFGAGLFVLGGVLELGGQLHLDASLYEAKEPQSAPRVLSKAAVRGKGERIFELVDQLTAELLAKRPGGPGARLTRIASMATDSFDALKAYLEGEAEMRAMRRVPAVDAYRRAVTIDPAFALAWYRLSVAALWSGQSHIAHEAARKAVEHGSRLSERDRDLLAAFDASLLGANEQAERRYRAILGTHPDDVEAWYQLGELLMHGGPLSGRSIADSREAWQRLIALDPKHVNGWIHLVLIAANTGDQAGLESSIRQALELSPAGDSSTWLRAFDAFSCHDATPRQAVLEALRSASDYILIQAISALGSYTGNYEGALELAGLATQPVRSTEVRALGHLARACFDLALGRWRASREELDLAQTLDPVRALQQRAQMAASLFIEVPSETLDTIREQVVRLAPPHPAGIPPRPAWIAPHDWILTQLGIYLGGILDARLGRIDRTSEAAAKLEAMGGSPETGSLVLDLALSLRAHAAWAQGDQAAALAILETTRRESRFDLTIWSPFYSQALERWTRAELLDLQGRPEEALRWFGSFGGNSIYEQIYVAPSHFRRAEICESMGLSQAAEGHYRRFAEIWATCDSELRPRVVEAQKRAGRLRG